MLLVYAVINFIQNYEYQNEKKWKCPAALNSVCIFVPTLVQVHLLQNYSLLLNKKTILHSIHHFWHSFSSRRNIGKLKFWIFQILIHQFFQWFWPIETFGSRKISVVDKHIEHLSKKNHLSCLSKGKPGNPHSYNLFEKFWVFSQHWWCCWSKDVHCISCIE